MKKTFSLLIAVAFILTATYFVIAAADGGYDGLYVVFGDSIAAGYGLDGSETGSVESMNYVAGRDSDAYAGIVSRALDYDLNNFAVSGHTTEDMLAVLKMSGVLDAVAKADLITVSIGGNDLIGMTSTILPIAAMYEAFGDYFDVARTDSSVEQMYSTLESNLTSIMQTLVAANKGKGKIYLQTLYNPFKYNETYKIDFMGYTYNMGNLINYYIDRVNEIYRKVKNKVGGFELVDTATALNADGRCFYEISTPDFHPTAYGHKMIAQTILAAYEKPTPTTEQTTAEPTTATTAQTVEATTTVLPTTATTLTPTTATTTEVTTTEVTTVVTTTATTAITTAATATTTSTTATTVTTTAEQTALSTASEQTATAATITTANTKATSTVSPTTSTKSTTSTTAAPEDDGGCHSAITGGAIIAVAASLICTVALKKRKSE